MSSTFKAFQTGLMAGQQQRQVRDQDAARQRAAEAYGSGNYEGASTALMKSGLYDEADAYTKAADRAKTDATTKQYADAYKMGAQGDGGTKGGFTALRDVAGQAGDIETVGKVEKSLAEMSAAEREQAGRQLEFSARLAFDLRNLPMEQRQEAMNRAITQYGGAFGITPDMAAQMGVDDATLDSTMHFTIDAMERLKMGREDQRNAVVDGQRERGLDLQEQGLNLQAQRLSEGSTGAATYRWARPEEVAQAGLPPGTAMQINERTGEASVKSQTRQTSEYDPVQVRQFRSAVGNLDLLTAQIDNYETTLKENGGVQTVEGPWNKNQVNAIDTARNNVLVLAKNLYELGALVGADFAIIEAAIKPATGFGSAGQNTKAIGASLAQVKTMLRNKLSQIPPEIADQVRKNYSNEMKQRFPVSGAAEASPVQGGGAPQATEGPPPGVDPEDWEFMSEEDKALFR